MIWQWWFNKHSIVLNLTIRLKFGLLSRLLLCSRIISVMSCCQKYLHLFFSLQSTAFLILGVIRVGFGWKGVHLQEFAMEKATLLWNVLGPFHTNLCWITVTALIWGRGSRCGTCVCTKLLQLCLTLWPHGLWPARLLCPWDSPGKNTGVGCHALFQGIFPPRDQTCISYVSCIGRQVLYHWHNPGSPR